MKKILFAASECVPFIKTGGLADVCGALPKMYNKDEWDVRVVLPYYTCIPETYLEQFEYMTHFYMWTGSLAADKYVGVFKYELDGITYYFIDNKEYFDCKKPYGDIRWDIERFSYYSKAVLAILPLIDFKPDVIHCHDWQASLIPVFLNNEFVTNQFYWDIKTVFTIHNLRFQGVWSKSYIQGITGLSNILFTADKLEWNGDANLLKGGLVFADYITTVSETYAQEIQTPEYGEGLQGVIHNRQFDMLGIVNGIDYDIYNPATDDKLYVNYDADNFRQKKVQNKTKLQKELGLTVDKKKFMIGLVSRLTDQKGLDLISYVMENILDEDTQFVVIGTGDARYEGLFNYYAQKYPDRVSSNIAYNAELAQKLYASADAFLMPSAFEPCGLTQLISFRYGTVPIVRETGGLKDTVEAYNEYEKTGTGFSFANYDPHEMLDTINYAKSIYRNKKVEWNKMVERGMKTDFSWKESAAKYEEVYNFLIQHK